MTLPLKRAQAIIRKAYKDAGWKITSWVKPNTACPDRVEKVVPGAPPEGEVLSRALYLLMEADGRGRIRGIKKRIQNYVDSEE